MTERKISARRAVPSILPTRSECRRACRSRDNTFDGRFFVASAGGKNFCRPGCSRQQRAERQRAEGQVRYFASAGEAHDTGLTPCDTCQPLHAPPPPEWVLDSVLLTRALRKLEGGYVSHASDADLVHSLSVDEAHLAGLFADKLATSAGVVAKLQRAALAWTLLTGSALTLTSVAVHAGYQGVRQLQRELQQVYQRSASSIRTHRTAKRVKKDKHRLQIFLPVRPPYHYEWVFTYLQRRALSGVEEVCTENGRWYYQRRISASGKDWLRVQPHENGRGLQVTLHLSDPAGQPAFALLQRLRRLFDVHGDGAAVHKAMLAQPLLAHWAKAAPGLRVPGAWDGFETAVRAILGQQVSVARGTELANKMIQQYGEGNFPTPQQLLGREVAELGMPGRRGRAVVYLAELVVSGELTIDDSADFDSLQQQLQAIDGIGPWTANYIRMRALKDADAFPDNDWVVLKQLQCTATAARQAAQAWQPWRAYALMYLWYAASQPGTLNLTPPDARHRRTKRRTKRRTEQRKTAGRTTDNQ